METKIKWRTGKPPIYGNYLVAYKGGSIGLDYYLYAPDYHKSTGELWCWQSHGDNLIIAWASLAEIDGPEIENFDGRTDVVSFDGNYSDEVEIKLPDDYEFVIKDGKGYAVRKKPEYPATIEECFEITKKSMTNYACEWLDNNANNYIFHNPENNRLRVSSKMIDDFRKVMENCRRGWI